MRKPVKKSNRGKLIRQHGYFIPIDEYKKAPNRAERGIGIYALYNNYGLYYIGLSEKNSIRSRIQDHTRDKHKGKWDKFSFFQIKRTPYIKDIETLILRIHNPTANILKGTLHKKHRIK